MASTDAAPKSSPVVSVIRRASASFRRAFAGRRPWPEFVDRSSFSKPESLADASSRVRKNFSYFRTNYLTVLTLILAAFLLSHPFSLLTLLTLIGAWVFVYSIRPADQPLVVLGRTFSDRESLGILVLATIVVVFLTSVGSLLISAALVGVTVVCLHGAFRDPEDLFMDEPQLTQDSGASTLFSLMTSTSAPQVMSQV